MTAENLNLAESTLKATYDYKENHICYERQPDRLLIWSNNGISETSFINVGIARYFQLWSMYVHIINNRVTLVIF